LHQATANPMSDKHFYSYKADISNIKIPEKFTFPFAYEPHALTMIAADELKRKLKNIYSGQEKSGKMFGVLVVKNSKDRLGYLAAFSGQVVDFEHDINFVPAIFDRLHNEGFFKQEEKTISDLTKRINKVENNKDYKRLQNELDKVRKEAAASIAKQKALNEKAKEERAFKRAKVKEEQADKQQASKLKKLDNESIDHHYQLKRLNEEWTSKVGPLQSQISIFEKEINKLKKLRKKKSAALQQKLFDQYQFLNANKETASLQSVFEELGTPPAGAGDCAGPKLLQYAFAHNYQPLAMGEFWWGNPPATQLRKEGRFYPACAGKCKPILGHMLEGLPLEDDPLTKYTAQDKAINIIFEDDHLLVINKPAGLLSIPSKSIKDAVAVRMQKKYPDATGPMVAHRLDKLTSGLMIITKSLDVYREVQQQFVNKTISKSYKALLEGKVDQQEGKITLPLSVDEFNRPMQMVNYEKGKKAETLYEVLKYEEERTLIKFTPVTGRTHQLRVHAAHPDGLNAPIVGDTLYGQKDERLMLHAARITFVHPVTKEELTLETPAEFENDI